MTRKVTFAFLLTFFCFADFLQAQNETNNDIDTAKIVKEVDRIFNEFIFLLEIIASKEASPEVRNLAIDLGVSFFADFGVKIEVSRLKENETWGVVRTYTKPGKYLTSLHDLDYAQVDVKTRKLDKTKFTVTNKNCSYQAQARYGQIFQGFFDKNRQIIGYMDYTVKEITFEIDCTTNPNEYDIKIKTIIVIDTTRKP